MWPSCPAKGLPLTVSINLSYRITPEMVITEKEIILVMSATMMKFIKPKPHGDNQILNALSFQCNGLDAVDDGEGYFIFPRQPADAALDCFFIF